MKVHAINNKRSNSSKIISSSNYNITSNGSLVTDIFKKKQPKTIVEISQKITTH